MNSIDELRDEIRILRNNNIDTDELVRIADTIERELEEEYVELPKDVNNIPVHIGDVLQDQNCGGGWCEPFKVVSMTMDNSRWVAHDSYAYRHRAVLCRHKPPTVEDVLREFVFDACGDSTPEEAVVKRFAERLRLREDD